MLLSRTSEYALQALLHLAGAPDGEYVQTQEIAQLHDLARHTLSKILQTLVKNRLLDSQKGPGGGVKLAKPSTEITLLEVAYMTEGPDFLQAGCVFGLPHCSDLHPCPAHEQWMQVKETIHNMFATMTVAQLLDTARQGDTVDFAALHLAFP